MPDFTTLSWERIADVLNLLDGFNINQRSVRDRFTHLLNKYKQKRAAEHRASGIVPEHTQLDDYLEELDSLFSEAEREKDDDNKKNREKPRKINSNLSSFASSPWKRFRKQGNVIWEVVP